MGRCDVFALPAIKVWCAVASIEHCQDGSFHVLSFLLKMSCIAEKQCRRRNCAERISKPSPTDVRRRAVNGFVKPYVAADAGGGEQAQRARDDGCFVRENVAEQIFSENYVERARFHHQMHRTGVNIQVLKRDFRVIQSDARLHRP